ncbi:hypothetical protein H310_02913 [Aphanomyces invadans]|uniref:Ammonium transporter AmtB-like domain-containing protein n=1 Tax=Aphanomyces invadans TaxID=157072 RepID=A0A024UJX1_9STRA|nr:hypothetical protein H310_02913 [Aphanomyces invadans]ETW06751.1 hypothetical protein H310_02913 [Aphanomyces invadans]|eukprot:XP_008864826.1 hypothetical protein H310_02913 [Aphanomyces invadans]
MTDLSHATVRLSVDGSVLEYSWSDFAAAMQAKSVSATNSTTLNSFALQDTVDVLWILSCSMQILLHQFGLSFLASAASLPDSKSTGVIAVAVLLSYSFAFALSFGNGSFLGQDGFFLLGIPLTSPTWAFWVLQSTGALTMTSLVYHSLAHRIGRRPLYLYMLLLHGFVSPVLVHALWSSSGFVSSSNPLPSAFYGSAVVDYAGASSLHICAGMAVLVASCFSRDDVPASCNAPPVERLSADVMGDRSAKAHPSATAPSSPVDRESSLNHSIGSFLVFVAHFGLIHLSSPTLRGNCPDVVMASCVNLALSAAAGSVVCSILSLYFPTNHPMNHGLLGGLVAMSAAASTVLASHAVVIGAISGLVFVAVSTWTRHGRLNDALDAIAIHLGNGIWAVVAAGMFSYGDRIALANTCTFAAATTPALRRVNDTSLNRLNKTGGCEHSMWEGCGRQIGANIVWTIVVLLFVSFMCSLVCVPHYLKGRWAATSDTYPPLPFDPLYDVDEFCPTDDDNATPWSYHVGVQSPRGQPAVHGMSPAGSSPSSDGMSSPLALLCGDPLQSSIERRYRFSLSTSYPSNAAISNHGPSSTMS